MTRRFLPLFAATLLLGNATAFIARAQPPEPRVFQPGATPTPAPALASEPETIAPEAIEPEAELSPPGQSPASEQAQPEAPLASRAAAESTPPSVTVKISKTTLTVGEMVNCTITLTHSTGNKDVTVTLWCPDDKAGKGSPDKFNFVGGSGNQLRPTLEVGKPYPFKITGAHAGDSLMKSCVGSDYGHKLSENSLTIKATEVRVAKIQVQNGTKWSDWGGARSLLTGRSMKMRAVPSGGSWPAGYPKWESSPGVSLTVNSDRTCVVSYQQLSASAGSYKNVTAKAPGGEKVAQAVVCDFSIKTVPKDNFKGRSQEDFGVGEEVLLSTQIKPSGVSISSLGGANWGKTSRLGNLSNGSGADGKGTFLAGVEVEKVVLRLSFISQGAEKSLSRNVIAPTGAYMIKSPGTYIRHTKNTSSVGFLGSIYIVPRNVSFSGIQFREGTCKAEGLGFYKSSNGKIHKTTFKWQDILNGDIKKGCNVDSIDEVFSGERTPPFAWGSFRWPVPWQWKLKDGKRIFTFTTAIHYNTSDAYGTATIQKAEAGPFTKSAKNENSTYLTP